MTLKGLVLKNFRGYNEVILDLHPRYNLFRGANGSGKTTLLQAIAWAIRGANDMTSSDGAKNWRDLIRDGEKQMAVGVQFEELGYIERTRSLKNKHELVLPNGFGMSDTAAKSATPVLLSKIGIPEETLLCMLDTTPFVERALDKQRAALARILQGQAIEVPEEAQRVGVNTIQDSGHLDRIIKGLKENELRDAKRSLGTLQKQKIERPAWPAEGRTKEQIVAGRQSVVNAISKLEQEIGRAEAKIEGLETRKSQGVPTFEVLPDEEMDALNKELDAAVQLVSDLTEKETAQEEEIAGLTRDLTNLAALSQAYTKQLSELGEPIDCPADACPLRKEYAEKHGERRSELEAKIASHSEKAAPLSARKIELQEELDATKKALEEATATWQGLERKKSHHEIEAKRKEEFGKVETPEEIDAKVSALRTELETASETLADQRRILEMADAKMAEIAAFEEATGAAAKHEDTVRGYAEQVNEASAAIEALEKLRESIVGGKIEEFLKHINSFLSLLDVPEVGYAFDVGFTVGGMPLDRYLSAGETEMFFEAALRVGCAKLTGWDIVILDGAAQIDETHYERLIRALIGCGCQVLHVHTTEKTEAPASDKFKVFLVKDGDDGRAVEELGR